MLLLFVGEWFPKARFGTGPGSLAKAESFCFRYTNRLISCRSPRCFVLRSYVPCLDGTEDSCSAKIAKVERHAKRSCSVLHGRDASCFRRKPKMAKVECRANDHARFAVSGRILFSAKSEMHEILFFLIWEKILSLHLVFLEIKTLGAVYGSEWNCPSCGFPIKLILRKDEGRSIGMVRARRV